MLNSIIEVMDWLALYGKVLYNISATLVNLFPTHPLTILVFQLTFLKF